MSRRAVFSETLQRSMIPAAETWLPFANASRNQVCRWVPEPPGGTIAPA